MGEAGLGSSRRGGEEGGKGRDTDTDNTCARARTDTPTQDALQTSRSFRKVFTMPLTVTAGMNRGPESNHWCLCRVHIRPRALPSLTSQLTSRQHFPPPGLSSTGAPWGYRSIHRDRVLKSPPHGAAFAILVQDTHLK